MASAEKTMTVDVSSEKLMKVIRDYSRYSEFVVGCGSAKILKEGTDTEPTRAEYSIEVMGKKIAYVLDHFPNGENELSWKLVESNLMKENRGGWKLKPLGPSKTEVTYYVDIEMQFPVPGFVMNTLVKGSLPPMIESFAAQAKKRG